MLAAWTRQLAATLLLQSAAVDPSFITLRDTSDLLGTLGRGRTSAVIVRLRRTSLRYWGLRSVDLSVCEWVLLARS